MRAISCKVATVVASAAVAICIAAAPAFAQTYDYAVKSGETVTLSVGDKTTTETIYYRLGVNASVIYSSSDLSVASATGDNYGFIVGGGGAYETHNTYITAVSPGTATIYATDHNGLLGTYNVVVTRGTVQVPSCITSATYTGKPISAISTSSSSYTVEGGTATDAGIYTATVKLNDPSKYQWADGTTAPKVFTYEITKAGSGVAAKAQKATLKMKPSKKQHNTIKVSGASGRVTFKSATSKVKVSSAGKVTIPKGFKGTVKVYVTDKGDSNHNGKTVTVKFSVKK